MKIDVGQLLIEVQVAMAEEQDPVARDVLEQFAESIEDFSVASPIKLSDVLRVLVNDALEAQGKPEGVPDEEKNDQ